MSHYAVSGGAVPAVGISSLELIERSLAWVRPALVASATCEVTARTPCGDWDVGDLLAHMVDGFTAFVEAATGSVAPPSRTRLPRDPVLLAGHLLDLGCGVLGEWTPPARRQCRVGSEIIPTDALLQVAALEIAVHGWDLSRVSTPTRELPAALAAALLPVAVRVVRPADRPGRFGPIVHGTRRDPTAILLNHLGRHADAA